MPAHQVRALLQLADFQKELKTWSLSELRQLKQVSGREKDPETGRVERWEGVLLSTLIEKAIDGLPAEQKALVDFVTLKNGDGQRAILSRAFIVKYPVMLALASEGPTSVMPWTSRPKILGEGIPLEAFFLKGVREIELGNYRTSYASVFLKRRTDPAAMRGEKLFVQNCMACHAAGKGPAATELMSHANGARIRALNETAHPQVQGVTPLSGRDRRALMNYLDAHRAENSPVATTSRVSAD